MTKLSKHFLSLIVLSIFSASASAEENAAKYPIAIMHTTKGAITLELYADKAPVTVANFLDYAKSGFYNNTIFHRVIKRFMIQGGGFSKDMQKKTTNPPIVNEASNGIHNDRWTIAMARTNDPNSATSQFFINTKMNSALDKGRGNPGYTVFGAVIDGQHVVKAIEKTQVSSVGMHQHLPVEPIIIERITIESTTIESTKTK
ncbi:MAG: peptidylprolyl isomerase [Pseudomonadales bacterium]